MTDKIFFYPYTIKSKSARSLVQALNKDHVPSFLVKTENSAYKHNADKILINWGSTSNVLAGHQKDGRVINPTNVVKRCSNKLSFFNLMKDTGLTPEFTEDPEIAKKWHEEGQLVVARTELNAHSGKGIVFSDEDPEFYRKARLFVKYVKKKQEYRVHIFNGRIIDIQQKLVRTQDDFGEQVDPALVNYRVRSYANGFVFARNKDGQEIVVPECVKRVAVDAFNRVEGLTFGAMDVIYNQRQDRAYVLECNTAPGLEGTTLQNYVNEFKKIFNSR